MNFLFFKYILFLYFKGLEHNLLILLEEKYQEFTGSILYLEMLCVHKLNTSKLVTELISFQNVLNDVIINKIFKKKILI